MNLSKTKQKQIRRLAKDGRSAREIAKAVGLSPEQVDAAIREMAGQGDGPQLVVRDYRRMVEAVPLIAMLGILALAPLMHYRKIYNIANLPHTIYVQCAAVLVLLIWLVKAAVSQEKEKIRSSPFLLPLALFIVWAGLSYFWSINAYEHLYTWTSWLASAVIFFVALQLITNRRHIFWVLCTVHLMGFAVAMIGIWQHLSPWFESVLVERWGLAFLEGIFNFQIYQQVAPPAASFANKNFAVHVVVPTLCIGMGLFLWLDKVYTIRKLGVRIPLYVLPAVSCTLMTGYLYFSTTRAGWLALAIMLMLWGVVLADRCVQHRTWPMNMGQAVTLLATLPVLLIMIHLSPEGFQPTLKTQVQRFVKDFSALFESADAASPAEDVAVVTDAAMPDADDVLLEAPTAVAKHSGKIAVKPQIGADESFAGRLKVWHNTLYMIADYPIRGTGVGNYKIYFPIYDGMNDREPMFSDKIQISNTHNDFFQIWAETGSVGMALCIWIAVMMGLVGWRLWRRESADFLLVMAVFIGIIGLAVNAFFCSPMQRAIPTMILALLLASLTAWYRIHQKGRSLPLATPFAIGGAVLVMLAMLPVASIQLNRWRCDAAYVYVTAGATQQRWDIVHRYGTLAREHLPLRSRVSAFLGKAYVEMSDREVDPARKQEYLRLGLKEMYIALADYPNYPNLLFDVAVVYAKLEDWDKALDYYLQVNELLPNYPRLHNNIAAVFMQRAADPTLSEEEKNQYVQSALAEFQLETRLSPDNERVWFNYAVALRGQQKYALAEKYFHRAVEIKPDFAMGWKELGVLHYQFLNDRDKGLGYLAKAVEVDPEVHEADRIRALIEQRKQELQRQGPVTP